jgi:hypothetical protein
MNLNLYFIKLNSLETFLNLFNFLISIIKIIQLFINYKYIYKILFIILFYYNKIIQNFSNFKTFFLKKKHTIFKKISIID